MLKHSGDGYESAFDDESPKENTVVKEFSKKTPIKSNYPSKHEIDSESSKDSKRTYRQYFASLTAYDRHVTLINQYFLYHPNATSLLHRDTSRDKRDIDLVKENHQFLWDPDTPQDTWGQKLAKKYYDKLFKEYCICDLSKYKENKIGMRWRIEKEVVSGKGQFVCGEKRCLQKENLRSWEMNFGYVEHETKKNALIKLRLCHDCSYKLNYKQKRKEIVKHKHKKIKNETHRSISPKKEDEMPSVSTYTPEDNLWKGPSKVIEEKDREGEFEEYLEDLFM